MDTAGVLVTLRVVVETVVVVVALVVVGRVLGALVTGGVLTVMAPLSPKSRPGGLPGASGQVGGRGGALLVVLEGGRGVCFPGVDGWSLGLGAEGWAGPLVADLSGGVGIPGPRKGVGERSRGGVGPTEGTGGCLGSWPGVGWEPGEDGEGWPCVWV